MQAVKGLSMEKGLCWGALGVAALMLVLFLLDMIWGVPFGARSPTVDVIGIIASGVLVYLSWDALRDLL
jgi:hypothetical protein